MDSIDRKRIIEELIDLENDFSKLRTILRNMSSRFDCIASRLHITSRDFLSDKEMDDLMKAVEKIGSTHMSVPLSVYGHKNTIAFTNSLFGFEKGE